MLRRDEASADRQSCPGPLGTAHLESHTTLLHPIHHPSTGGRASDERWTSWKDSCLHSNPAMNNSSDLFTSHYLFCGFTLQDGTGKGNAYKMVSAGVVLVWIGKASRYHWNSRFFLRTTVMVLRCIYLHPSLSEEMLDPVVHSTDVYIFTLTCAATHDFVAIQDRWW